MENWETGGNRLKANRFLFPGPAWSFMGAENTFAPEVSSRLGGQSLRRLLPVTRRLFLYAPENGARRGSVTT